MDQLTWILAGMLRTAARLLPLGRQQWAEAVRAEAGQVLPGWPRLRWLAGGLWLAVREGANMMVGKVVYWLGAGAVAAAAGWVVWLSWRTSPAADPQTVTDRVRVLVGAAALVVLPWVGRRRGWFGPVGSSLTARLVRVAGCAAVCGLGVVVVRMDSHLGLGPHGPGPFSLPHEITALVLLSAALAALAVVKARWPNADPSAQWILLAIAGLLIFIAVPLQALAIVYVAGILAATSRRSPVTNASLAVGAIAGLAAGLAVALAVYELATPDDRYLGPVVLGMLVLTSLLAALAGVAAAWLLPGTGDPQELREARIRQGLLAGSVAGAVCGLLLTNFFVVAVFMMIIGPLLGAGGGAFGGIIAAYHPRRSRPAHSWSAGLFVSHW
jgi:hypothetical protein